MKTKLQFTIFLLLLALQGFAQILNESQDLAKNGSSNTTTYLLVIVVVIALGFIAYMVYSTALPPKLRHEARLADIQIPRFDLLQMRFRGIPPATVVEILVKCKNADLDITLKEVEALYVKEKELDVAINSMILANFTGLKVSFTELIKHLKKGGTVDTYITIIKVEKNADRAGLGIPRTDLESMYFAKNNIELFVKLLARSKNSGLDINHKEFVYQKMEDDTMEKLINAMIDAHRAGILNDRKMFEAEPEQKTKKILLEELIALIHTGEDINKFVKILIRIKNLKLNITLQRLIKLGDKGERFVNTMMFAQSAGLNFTEDELLSHDLVVGDMEKFAKAIGISKNPDLAFDETDIKKAALKGVDVLNAATGVLFAKSIDSKLGDAEKLNLDFGTASRLAGKGSVIDIVKSCIIPRIIFNYPKDEQHKESEAHEKHGEHSNGHHNGHANNQHLFKVVSKDGIEIIPKANIMVRLQLVNYTSGSDEDFAIEKVNETIINVIESYPNHHAVVENLDEISHRVTDILRKDEVFKKHSKYEVLEVTIPEVDIGDDTYAEHKRHHALVEAELIKAKAEAKLLDAESKVQEAFAKAIANGKFKNINEMHKHKIYYKKEKEEEQKDNGNAHGHGHGDHEEHDEHNGNDHEKNNNHGHH